MKTIFIEGVDAVGKSTLIDHLYKLGDLTHHFATPLGNTNTEKYFYQQGQFEAMFRNISDLHKSEFLNTFTAQKHEQKYLFDRSHIGEYVWGPLYRKKFPIYLPKYEHEHARIYGDKTLTILLVCFNEDMIKARFEKRGEEMPNNWFKIQDMFIEAITEISPFKHMIFDTGEENIEELDMKVSEIIKKGEWI